MEVESNLHLFLFQINHATLFFYFKQKKLNLYTILRNEVILSSVMLSCGRPGTDRRSFPSGYLIHPLAPIAPLQKNLSTNSAPTVVALSTTVSDLHAGLHHATAHLPFSALHRAARLHHGIRAAATASAARLAAEQVLTKGALA
jgi:hypothetical protein